MFLLKRSHRPSTRISVSSLKHPYTHAMQSRISNPAILNPSPTKSCVRVPANDSRYPPGFNTRRHSFHCAGCGTNASHSLPMKPLPLTSWWPVSSQSRSIAIASGSFPSPYGGSVTIESTELSGISFIRSRQSPSIRWNPSPDTSDVPPGRGFSISVYRCVI